MSGRKFGDSNFEEHDLEIMETLKPTATFEDVEVYRSAGDRSVLLFIPDQECGRPEIGEVWVPRSVIDRESQVPNRGKGYLIVDRWYAERCGWVP